MKKKFMGAGLIALALFLAWALDVTAYRKISVLRAAVSERETLVAERKAILDNVRKLKIDYDKQFGEVQRFSSVLPTKKQIAELLFALDVIAAQSGLQLTNLSTKENPGGEQNAQSLSINIEAQGTYQALKLFLAGMEQNIRLIDVQSLDAALDAQRPSFLNVKMQANAYFLK